MTDKLAFKLDVAPERGTILPIKMDQEKWFALAEQNNRLRVSEYKPAWHSFAIQDLYDQLHA